MAVGPTELKTLSRLLDEALALHPSERDRWLASLNARDAAHRETLAQLLAEADEPDDAFLTRPGLEDRRKLRREGSRYAATEHAGMLIGPYVLERQIGSGGMGSVWLARRVDGVLEREVALKLPHVSWVPALNARLARERDILARLTHPNIARLYDAGADEQGRPYLALEYVEGLPIDEYVRRNELDTRQRLLLFKQVASAVAYAHGHLVVHRDLKPSNVLVDSEGAAHLLDFGVAKLLSDEDEGLTQLTRATGRMLTPGYASPEQIRGEPVTVASDVYSLGVLLYEMLTHTRPFHVTGASLTELEAAATEELAPLASSRVTTKPTQRALRGDLDTILAKALRKEADARYRTVDALIDDLDRHISGEPVLARPASGWYRASRFVSRHSDYVLLASAAMVAMLVGLGAAILQAQRAEAQAERAEAVRDFVLSLFDLNHGDVPNKIELRQFPAYELAERGARRIAARYENRPALRAEMLGIAGTIFADIGEPTRAAELVQSQLAALDAAPTSPRDRVEALRVLARAQLQQMQTDLAEQTLKEAIRLAEPLTPQERAELHTSLADLLEARAQYSAASGELDQAEALLTKANARRSAVFAKILLVRAQMMLWDRKDPTAARPLFDSAIKLMRDLTGPLSPESIWERQSFARALIQFGEVSAGRALLEQLLADIRRASGNDDLEAVTIELGLIESISDPDLGLPPEDAPVRVERLLSILDQDRSRVPQLLQARADMVAGRAYAQRGEIARSEPLMRRMLPVLVEHGPSREEVSWPAVFSPKYEAMYVYAQWADERGDSDEATRLWDEIYSVRRAALYKDGVQSDAVLDPQFHAILSRTMAGDLKGSEQRLADVKTRLGLGTPDIVNIRLDSRWEALALELLIRIESGQFSAAAKLLEERKAEIQNAHATDLSYVTFNPTGLAGLQAVVDCNMGKPAAGLERMTALLNTVKDHYVPASPRIAALRARIGLCALRAGQPKIARQMQQAARQAFTEQPGVSSFYKKPLLELEKELSRSNLATN
jgi:serine/threonine protein kinase/tetratricopeptide (TPR) repeat protein